MAVCLLLPERPEELESERPLDAEDGIIIVGDKGKILVRGWGGESPRLISESKHRDFKFPAKTLPRSIGHHDEWVKACKQGTPTASHFGFAGPLTEAVLLGSIAIRLGGEKLLWDAANLQVTNPPKPRRFCTIRIARVGRCSQMNPESRRPRHTR